MSIQYALAFIDAYTMGAGRLGSSVAGLTGLTGVIIGGRALARRAGGRNGAVAALAAGLTGIVLGVLVAATADDGVGSGNGLGGAVVAVILGLIATILGALALARTRRSGASA
ncbi:DUF6223 family protein [Actinomadura sp. 6K520]|uniref:DUF6223 family protein n=1 Tax=Actinomadura sp. 6K520 TaxID=2530364 RepID=UPI001049BB48|nr:DUF6223 family protein [Actinomadura sp. 6K520]TDE36538.1 hypothetical protein E1289_05840 [Actinomadura sp. 6K520]